MLILPILEDYGRERELCAVHGIGSQLPTEGPPTVGSVFAYIAASE